MITTDAYFENIKEEILKELDLANQSIFVAVAWFTEKSLFNKLMEKLEQGVSVSLLINDDEINHTTNIDFKKLGEIRGFFKFFTGELMHNKFCVIDKRVVITGSFNWTNKAASQNQENITITQGDFDLAFRFIQQFNSIAGIEQSSQSKLDYSKLIKRLNIIKDLIGLGDEEDVEYQCKRLKKEDLDEEIKQIVLLIEDKSYEKALSIIEEFVYSRSRLTVYYNPRISALQLEIKNLKFRIISIDEEIAEKSREINHFNTFYYKILGKIISQILELKEKYYEKQRDKSKFHEEDYNNAKEEKTEFEDDKKLTEKRQSIELNVEDKIKLKKLHRKGVVLCHPDKVLDEYKETATAMFNALQNAYEKQDLAKITELVAQLEAGQWDKMRDEEISDIEILELKKQQYISTLNVKLKELNVLISSFAYQELKHISDLDTYLESKKKELETELTFWLKKNEKESISA